jgi:hypothetical protein
MRSALAFMLVACTGEPPPDCPSPLPSQIAPQSMETLFWTDESGCIEVTYNPVLRDREQEVIDAANAWLAIPCNAICFSAPEERATPADGRPVLYSIHFTELTDGENRESTTQLWYRLDTGQVDRALVKVDRLLLPNVFRRAVLRGMGRALAFDEPADEVESVLHPLSDLTELTAADQEGFCSKYGTCLVSGARR